MKLRTRLILALLILITLGFCGLVYWIIDDLRPRYLATMEESMIETSTLLAGLLERHLDGRRIDVAPLSDLLTRAHARHFSAQIYEELKQGIDLRVYVTGRDGVVLYDSDGGRDVGKNFLRWLDVGLTLKGHYGARTTPEVKGDPGTAVLYVGAPIKALRGTADETIVGVVTVCKKARSATRFLIWARKRIIVTGVFGAMAIVLLGMIVTSWITLPIERLTAYARAVRDGRRVSLPPLGRNEIGQLGTAFEQMKDALEGKEYISQYVQTLTHEMKSPLSAIRGAAELLEEPDMPPAQRERFLGNIRAESDRMQNLIDRLLQLAALEQRKGLRDTEVLELVELAESVVSRLQPVLAARGIAVAIHRAPLEITPAHASTGDAQDASADAAQDPIRGAAAPDVGVLIVGETFLVRLALDNVLRNAIDFSPEGGAIDLTIARAPGQGGGAELIVEDDGPGVPEYALGRVFDRFYSLQRPGGGKKSSGLGLTIVREVMNLHGGSVEVRNASAGARRAGARVTLRFPASEPR